MSPEMIELKKKLTENLFLALKDTYPLQPENIELADTPYQKMGDLALALPFQLAKSLKKSPRDIATEISPLLSSVEGVLDVQVAGGGFINLFLDRLKFFSERILKVRETTLTPDEEKIIIEHTNINPNKAAHIGHLRNAVLGDTLGRCSKYKGEKVEIQNYIDDTGVQVVDVVFGFMDLEGKNLSDIEAIKEKFDYYCWDLYAKVSTYFESHPEAAERRSEILKKIEQGKNPEAEIGEHISFRILSAHLQTMKRLGIVYDVLPKESSILDLKFWEKAFQLLKEKDSIHFSDFGDNKGCWVMKLESDEQKEKIIVRSDGTVTYVGKDIAYQLWKFGLLAKDFYYRPLSQEQGHTTWITVSIPSEHSVHFGGGSLVYNVIDTRQSYLQQIVAQGLKSLHYGEQAEKSIHFSYEMVALSPKSLEELGLVMKEEDKDKSFLEVSGRKGLGVKADDLLDKLEQNALTEVEKRNPDLPQDEKIVISRQIACGALRYFMLKFAKNSLIVFDFEEALSFEGETGPYLQYTFVRINSIFRKLEEREGFREETIAELIDLQLSLAPLDEAELDDFWELVFYGSRLDEEVLHSLRSLEFSHLAKFSFNLCQKFNSYYHKYSILAEENQDVKTIRILTLYFVKEMLKKALELMGIPTPARM
jgi:arginyl-tRNA synthetase